LHVTVSVGIGVYPDDGMDAETLKNADTALLNAKAGGRGKLSVLSAVHALDCLYFV